MSLLPTLPAGMRDFGPEVMACRTYMCDVIRQVFIKCKVSGINSLYLATTFNLTT
ncbi:MAG: hypothetical protein AAF335_04480 [Bacteroidota bacterium]